MLKEDKVSIAQVKQLTDQLTQAGDKGKEIFSKYTLEEQKAVLDYFIVTKVETKEETKEANELSVSVQEKTIQAAQLVQTKSSVKEVAGYNFLGDEIWTYKQILNWQFDGTKIVGHSVRYIPQTKSLWWTFNGSKDGEAGGNGQWMYQAWSTAEFVLSAVGQPVQQMFGNINTFVFGDGTSR
jgi:hypothetical protein